MILEIFFIVRLTGSKLGCGEGGCGACTVMVSYFDKGRNVIRYGMKKDADIVVLTFLYRHSSINGCLAPLCSMDGMAVTTVEGIGSARDRLHPCQVCSACYSTDLTLVCMLVVWSYTPAVI